MRYVVTYDIVGDCEATGGDDSSTISTVRQMLPAGNFDVQKNPLVAAAFLIDLVDR
jgi:hypothetical protein